MWLRTVEQQATILKIQMGRRSDSNLRPLPLICAIAVDIKASGEQKKKKISLTGATSWRQSHHFVWPYSRVHGDPSECVLPRPGTRVAVRRSPVVATKESAHYSLVLGHVYSFAAMFSPPHRPFEERITKCHRAAPMWSRFM